ncbi:MAG: NAD(P)/FAD-dependent oxidoreductase [Euryarchaeota archaeon]|nr:NAD(P)/FAD-dependent oxidoreductase [Euryarchaeota archaeon]
MKDAYDVVVVGAGPGGSNTARVAAEHGLEVLLLEKRPEIGAPKRCGEGFSVNGAKTLGIKPDPRWTINEIWGANIVAPNGRRVSVRYEKQVGWVIERKMFDKLLAIEAARAGAEVLARSEVVGLVMQDGFVRGVEVERHGERLTVEAKIVVAADGVESKVARWAGIDSTQRLVDIDSAYQYEMVVDLEEPDMLDLYFGNDIAPRGYVWVFPKGKDVANVGIGIGGNVSTRTAKQYLDEWIAKHEPFNEGRIIEVNAGGVPVGAPLEKLVANGLMVVGDAAHQVNAIHGGGVFEASFAGQLAGRVAAEAIERGDVSEAMLMKYDREWRAARGEILHRIYKLRRAIEQLSDEDLNYLAEQLTGEDVVAFANGERLGKLAKILMKRPHLIKAAKELM